LISSSNPDGIAYIQTSSLDGEKTLKKRRIPKNLETLIPQHEAFADGLVLTA